MKMIVRKKINNNKFKKGLRKRVQKRTSKRHKKVNEKGTKNGWNHIANMTIKNEYDIKYTITRKPKRKHSKKT
jgi:hypothetical protein